MNVIELVNNTSGIPKTETQMRNRRTGSDGSGGHYSTTTRVRSRNRWGDRYYNELVITSQTTMKNIINKNT